MAPSRRLSNGRSPLVATQRQITAFFSLGKRAEPNPSGGTLSPSPSPDPTPTPPASKQRKPPLVIGHTPRLSPDPTPTPPPSKQRKPSLVIGHNPARTPPSSSSSVGPKKKGGYAEEVVGRRVRVFWPLDKEWYEGHVKSYDEAAGKHVVQYDDAEEEVLDLGSEKVEWVEEEETPRSFRRLRRRISVSEEDVRGEDDAVEGSGAGDSTDDEDWGKSLGNELEEDDFSEEMELEDEEEEAAKKKRKHSSFRTPESRKRGNAEVDKVDSAKKPKSGGSGGNVSPAGDIFTGNTTPTGDVLTGSAKREKDNALRDVDSPLTGDAAERFGKREAEKFQFLQDFYCRGHKDANGRQPGSANYDPKTVYLPPDFLRGLSGCQRQWWDIKSKHMDKVLFFKMGKFYELFEMDAHVGAKELGLQYMKGEQPHCGFPEKNFSMNLEKLARKGYRVLVVEQTETPEQLEIRRKEMGSKDKVVKREICAVVTKGTLVEGELLSTNPDASYLMSLTEKCLNFENQGAVVVGVCVVDVSTSKFILGQFEDDADRHILCSVVSELRPVEIIKPSKVLSPETEMVLQKHTRSPLLNDLVPSLEFWDAEKTKSEMNNIYERKNVKERGSFDNCSINERKNILHMPDLLVELINAGEDGNCALSAFGGCLFYLRQTLLDETLLRCAKFEPLPCSNFLVSHKKPYMILDAAALENLEILENSKSGGHSGTLLAQLDHCVTASGKRLLRSWLVRPLYDAVSIVERQDAILGLKGTSLSSALEFRKILSRIPDMERLLARLFACCEANGRNATKVVLYEDAAKKQLKEFVAALRGSQLMDQACSSLSNILDNTNSSLLHHLLTPGKGLPEVASVLKHFENAFDWTDADQSGRIIPHEGADIDYDSACKRVKDIEIHLKRYLKEQKVAIGDALVNYVTVGKDSYLLEVPEHLRDKVPRDYELQSSKKGYLRFWTPKIKKWLSELSQAEAEREVKLKGIFQRLIEQFSEHHIKWRQLVSVTAELDILISLGIACDYYEGPTCRPSIRATSCSDEVTPFLSGKSLGHPLLRSDGLHMGSFVPNDIRIGGAGQSSFILLTGPNMGGKSTLLRQVCLAVILAHIGADVPAENFELSPVDRIFVRMGAKDHIMAGQSTFLTELSETASMLSSATCNSLVALDELGRGTSTSDGQAIAQSVLDFFVHTVQCRGMFSTHYHRLALDYEKDPKVSLCHMACQVGSGGESVEKVTFLYRLTPGSCPKSYGINVARLAGLPSDVLQKAVAKSREFEASYGKRKYICENEQTNFLRDEEVAAMKDILRITASRGCHQKNPTASIKRLTEFQLRIRSVVQQN